MGDRGREQGARGAGASLLGSVIAVGGVAAMGGAARTLLGTARDAHGEEQLIGWVLVGLAGAGAMLCLYLALIWALATAILLAGPAGRTGRMLLPALRVLAPRLARRVSTGAAVATATTGLLLGPALASEQMPLDAETPTVFEISQLLPEEDPSPPGPESSGPAEPLPSLGWGGEPAPATEAPAEDGDEAGTAAQDDAEGIDGADEEPTTAPAWPAESGRTGATDPAAGTPTPVPPGSPGASSPDDGDAPGDSPESGEGPSEETAAPEESATAGDAPQTGGAAPASGDAPGSGAAGDGSDDPAAPRTVVVQQGDTLWSITDDLLGPAPEEPALLASSWPLLHQENQDVIGEDADLLVPGQVLTVPAAFDEEAVS